MKSILHFENIFVFLHDGIYCVHTGAGVSNRRFLYALRDIGLATFIKACPVFTSSLSEDFSAVWANETRKKLTEMKIQIIPVDNGTKGMERYGGMSEWKAGSQSAYQIIEQYHNLNNLDLVISFDSPFTELIRLLDGIPNLYHVHVPRSTALIHDFENLERKRFEEENYEIMNKSSNTYLGATGISMKKHLLEDYKIAPQKLLVLRNGILLNEYKKYAKVDINKCIRELKITPYDNFLLSYGRAVKYKGFENLIESLKILGEFAPNLVLFATSADPTAPYIRELEELSNRYRIKRVIITKFDYIRPRILQQAAQLISVVVPSLKEPFGLIPIEVMANPYTLAPVIGSNTGGLTEQIVDNFNGFMFDANSPNELAEKILHVKKLDKFEKIRLKSNGLADVKRNFDYKKNIKSFFEELNHKLIAKD